MANRTITQAVRIALVSAGTIAAGLQATPVVAQEQLGEIIVTGSRIASANLDSISPMEIISAEAIKQSGVVNVQDLLLKNPSFGTPALSRTNSNFFTTSAGVANVDLLNLGSERTLVLVDGRRFVAGQPGGAAVDLNDIPTQFIERIDVLTGGASAIYGSDAVAGVVNFIYKKNFEGVEVDLQSGSSKENDNRQNQFSITMGANTADGKGNLMAHLGYTDQGAVYSRDRKGSAVDEQTCAFVTGDLADAFESCAPNFSSFAPQGRQFTKGKKAPDLGWTTDAAGNVIPWDRNGTSTAATGFNRSAFRTIAVPVERYLFATRGSYEFAENHSAFIEGTYVSTQASARLEPFPAASADIYSASGGQVPIEFLYEGRLRVNPTLPSYIRQTARDEDGDGLRDYYFTRRLAEVGTRQYTADRDTFRAVAGFEGNVFSDWNYEAFYAYGQTKESQLGSGQMNVLNFRNALEAVRDVTDVDGDLDTTEAICRDAEARAQGCVPISVIGYNSITPEALAYIDAPQSLQTFTTQELAGVNLTGDLVDLWAGPLGVAVGAEYRKEFSRSEFDALSQAGLNAGNKAPPTIGEFDVTEFYLEGNLPLLTDAPYADRLNLRAAYRYADYSTVGSVDSWNAGLEWAPIPQLRFRGVYAETTRAPNIGELFQPPSETFPSGLIDPCKGVTLTSTTPSSDACRAAAGVVENINTNGGVFTLNQADLQGIGGFDRGNPLLGAEVGKSWTYGAVFTPDNIAVLENFTFSIDYFDIKIEEAIVATPRQFILEQCYSGDASYCSFITRRPTQQGGNSSGSLDEIDSAVTNSGGLRAEGITLTVGYAQALGPGQFNARLIYGYAIDGYLIPLPGAPKDPFVDEIGGSENRANLALGYQWSDFGVTWLMNYIGGACLDDQFQNQFDKPHNACIDHVLYNDVQLTWTPGDRYELYIGADNVFDEEAPPIWTNLAGNTTGTSTAAGTYDAIGQRWYAGVRAKF